MIPERKIKGKINSSNNFRPFITKILGNFSSGLQAYNSNNRCNRLATLAQPDDREKVLLVLEFTGKQNTISLKIENI